MSDNQHRHGQAPVDSPWARWFAVLLAVALIVVALLAARDLYIRYIGPAGWNPWLVQVVDAFRTPDPVWVGVGGVLAMLIGLAGVIGAIMPRRHALRALAGTGASVWVRRVDLARYTTAAAKRLPGVISASSLAKRRSVMVTAEIGKADNTTRPRLQQDLSAAVRPIFGEDLTVRVILRDSTADDPMLPTPTNSVDATGPRARNGGRS